MTIKQSQNTNPIRIAIMGDGRMGSRIRSTAEAARTVDSTNHTPVFEVVAQIGFDISEADHAPDADVLIDFSNVATLSAVVAYVKRTGAALVSGTTGYDARQLAELNSLAQGAVVLHSGNFSLGVAALRHASALVARELAGFDVEIVETHHNHKVDAPSGTAKLLLDAVIDAEQSSGRGTYHPTYGRVGMVGERESHEVGVHSLRGGTVAGVHTVSFFGTDEEVSLTHRATSRQIFVDGALAAARKVVSYAPGMYAFDEVMFSENR